MSEKKNAKKLKKLRILDQFLIILANYKILIKEPNEARHFTMKFLEKGIVDVHETLEGRQKEHIPIGKLDLRKFWETFLRGLPFLLKEIDINDPKFASIGCYIIPEKEELKKAWENVPEFRRKEIILKKNHFEKVMKTAVSIALVRDLPNYDFRVAFSKQGEEFALYRINRKYFLVKLDDFNELAKKALEESKISTLSYIDNS